MNVKFEARFSKDLRTIREQKLLNKVKEVIDDCKSASSLSDINRVKKMQGYDNFYRIRIGEYRIGISRSQALAHRYLHNIIDASKSYQHCA